MYNQFSLEKMARDHHQELLREAENYRIARMTKMEGQSQANLLYRLLTIFTWLLIKFNSQDAEPVSFTPTEAKKSGSL